MQIMQSLYLQTLYLLYHHERGTHQVCTWVRAGYIEGVRMHVEVHVDGAQGVSVCVHEASGAHVCVSC